MQFVSSRGSDTVVPLRLATSKTPTFFPIFKSCNSHVNKQLFDVFTSLRVLVTWYFCNNLGASGLANHQAHKEAMGPLSGIMLSKATLKAMLCALRPNHFFAIHVRQTNKVLMYKYP